MIITEDGTGLEDAETIVSAEYLLDYCTKRGYDITNLTGKEEQYLRLSNEYFYSAYSFKGTKFKETQSMPFPRIINGEYQFPSRIKNAVCELTLKLPNGTLLEDTSQKVIKEKVGELEVQYSENSSQEVNYNFVFNLIAPWLDNTSSYSSSIVRTY